MARSPPGHATPRPSPNQNAPKLPIRTPTENFSVFSGIAASGLRRASAATATATAAPAAPKAGGDDQVTAGTNREHDEDHLEPLQDHGLQGGHKRDRVPPFRRHGSGSPERRGRALECAPLVTNRHDPGRPQHRLTQPGETEQQEQKSDDELKDRDGDDPERWAENHDERGQNRESAGRSEQRRPPSSHGPDGQNDGDRLDTLDQ